MIFFINFNFSCISCLLCQIPPIYAASKNFDVVTFSLFFECYPILLSSLLKNRFFSGNVINSAKK